ncbi:MAG: hypothetical protein IJV00_08040 [Clostridia bacterium]|nr:hypothetical protein [Clostridia bacterium]
MKRPDAAVFILLGQSNAVGYATLMPENERIVKPLKNVFGLNRDPNLSYDIPELVWTGYTGDGTILGEENDHTYSVSNCLARQWQDAKDAGEDLPDLYVINISIGAEGVTKNYMWSPDREKILVPGKLGTVKVSLYPLALHIFSLIQKSFEKMNKSYRIAGIHWRGGEQDFTLKSSALKRAGLKKIYERLFSGFYESLGLIPPVVLHRIVCPDRALELDPTGGMLDSLQYINKVFDSLARDNANVSVFDVRNAPQFVPDQRGSGLFIKDLVHYRPEVNIWVASQILEDFRASLGAG